MTNERVSFVDTAGVLLTNGMIELLEPFLEEAGVENIIYMRWGAQPVTVDSRGFFKPPLGTSTGRGKSEHPKGYTVNKRKHRPLSSSKLHTVTMELVPSVHPALPSQPRYSIRPAQPQPRRIYAWANGLLPFGGLAVQGVLRRSARAAYADAGATDPKGQLLLLCAAGNRGFSAKEAEKDEARNDANLGGVVGL